MRKDLFYSKPCFFAHWVYKFGCAGSCVVELKLTASLQSHIREFTFSLSVLRTLDYAREIISEGSFEIFISSFCVYFVNS